ncbi:MAG: alpha/beta fold hydrolase [Mesorhizobium sp.]|nr:alpha/beta fold hydrolase [Mesorhizobium sp.]
MGRKIVVALGAAAVALAALYALGPRVAVDTRVTFDASSIGADPDAYLAAAEARFTNIRPGQAKEIVWAYPHSHAKTPLAIVYIHGFSASKGEVRPLPDKVAAALGANLFYTRLTGHSQDGAAMATASVNAWVNDVAEALAIVRAIGERLVVIGTSTGGSLTVWASAQKDLAADIAGLVLISPNFAVKASGAWLLTMPWGEKIAELVVGEERGFEPANDLQRAFWTTRYPTRATLPMAATVKLARSTAVEAITIPALFILSDADQVVDPEATKQIAARWGGPHAVRMVEQPGDPSSHVLAGDALSPSMTEPMAAEIVAWIKALG